MYEFIRLATDNQKVSDKLNNSPKPYEDLIPEDVKISSAANNGPLTSSDKPIAIGAHLHGVPVGIILASANPASKTADIRTLFVLPAHRGNHIGQGLMAKALEECKQEGAVICMMLYLQEDPATPALEQILKATAWQGPRPFMLRSRFTPHSFDTPWMHHNYRYPPEYEEFPWKNLTSSDRADLTNRAHHHHFPPALSPFREEDSIEYMNSLGLRREGKVVGWVITHRTDPDTVRYSSVFIEKDLQDRGLAMKLLANSLLLHAKFPSKWALLEMPYLIVHTSWAYFIKKRLVPLAVETTHLLQAWRSI